jgi:hypothetical protein
MAVRGEGLLTEQEINQLLQENLEATKQIFEINQELEMLRLELIGIDQESETYKIQELFNMQERLDMADELALTERERLQLQIDIMNLGKEILKDEAEARLDYLEHRKAMGEFDDNEEAYNKEKLWILQDMLRNAEQYGLTQKERWDIEEKIYEMMKAETDELQKQSGLTSKILTDLTRKYNMEIMQRRKAGTLTTKESQEELETIANQIIQEMRNLGYSEADIARTIESLGIQRQFEKGGRVPYDMLALLHEDEIVVPPDLVKEAGKILQHSEGFKPEMLGTNDIQQQYMQPSYTNIVNYYIEINTGENTYNISEGSKKQNEQKYNIYSKKDAENIVRMLKQQGIKFQLN